MNLATRTLITSLTCAAVACAPAVAPYVPAGESTTIQFPDPGDGARYSVAAVDASQHSATCQVPCEATLASGTSRFTFTGDNGQVVTGTAILPTTPSSVTFHHRRKTRFIAGAVLTVTGTLLGLPVMIDNAQMTASVPDIALAVVGIGALIAGGALMMTAGNDGVDVR